MKSTANERIYRYELQESALEIYRILGILEKVGGLASCSRFSPMDNFCLGVLPDGSVALYGLNKCHCRSSCPVCALGRDVESLSEIQRAIWKARKKSIGVYLITYTFSHVKADRLDLLQKAFSEAKQRMYRNGSFRKYINSLGYLGRITDYEVQLLGNNGYHPHTHDLEFLDGGLDLDELGDILADYWMDALSSVGLCAKKEISCKVQGYEGVGDYITKMSSEITLGNHTKKSWSDTSVSPFECLRLYHETKDMYYGAWWADYVLNVKGKRLLGWSRGLKDFLEVKEFKDELTSEKTDYRSFLMFSSDEIRKLKPSNWRTIAEAVNSRNLDYVLESLNRIKISYYVNPSGLQLYNEGFYYRS